MTVYFGGYLAWTLIGVLAGIEFGLDMMSTFLSGMHSCLENQTRGLFFHVCEDTHKTVFCVPVPLVRDEAFWHPLPALRINCQYEDSELTA
jgi:hypothetical protein